ncbi:fumarylacetoacetate hydrolase family protein [Rhodococcus sp. BP-349]|uniref:fumarylacetoacetate hydrolase family protein n=1 Tax=unclassified Rhodococcus (in: high G+C Gram-positive bacteria) TaxID=192944 RepID=UPI001C9B6463|nr:MULTISPECIES: fumarylacetoacetate hydrolase family protein [unclassified Rhodococcus (in: high G+C Gram-positive bacteria)]MBY6539436.1 fumarylacetoacetate hydrolase family protein [Rhodococcus sp. BP-363]MBY6544236.1 fumarylacetoacetate hydrolase family protein [Rhodococcus sp. BP-369]MBY6563466.1 fumarylacetoacetate hydrolase family protein [Rhodococcus sp. BP-370]MBY6577758.1 fumarylacetoacetate hydrolase family protein [Rhodococcus sp. BP-364]MBY6587059.1 fumarylacetoacetate hydrolase f
MRLRRGMAGIDVLHETTGTWVDLRAAGGEELPSGIVDFLGAGERARDAARDLVDRAVTAGTATASTSFAALPFEPRSLRCFAGWDQHWHQAAEQMVRRNLPAVVPLAKAFQAIARKPFPPLRPGAAASQHPIYYTGNHLSVVGDGEPMAWPAYTELLDFELEFGAVVVRPVVSASTAEAEAAIGGFVVFNDFSARDVQWDEQRNGPFGPVVKTKTFGSSMSAEVVTADEVLPHLTDLRGTVTVNGEVWSETSTRGGRWSLVDGLAYASRSESIGPGELLTSGTLPSGCGMELDRWVRPGDVVRLEVERIGSVTNTVAEPA